MPRYPHRITRINPFTGQPITTIRLQAFYPEHVRERLEAHNFSSGLSIGGNTNVVPNSFLGGCPAPQPPRWPHGTNGAMQFVCQIDFAEVTSRAIRFAQLPTSGLLQLWADCGDLFVNDTSAGGGWCALWDGRCVVEPKIWADAPPNHATAPSRPIGVEEWSVESPELPNHRLLGPAWWGEGLLSMNYFRTGAFLRDPKLRQLLTHVKFDPNHIEKEDLAQLADALCDCGLAPEMLGAGAANWGVLLAIGSDEHLHMEWGDLGSLVLECDMVRAIHGDLSDSVLTICCS